MDLYSVRKSLSLGVPLANLKLRVTDYSRVSTDDIKQKNSLKNQTKHFSEMIKQNENWTYVKGYVDDGITGTSDIKRDNFMRMIEDGKKGKFDLIITKEISRFSRNTLDSIKYTRELLQSGVAVLFVNDNINTIMPDSELRLTIMASMAQDEIRRLSERVKFGMNRAIIDGHILGNDRLYGYKKNKLTGNLEIDVDEGEVVKKIYDMYVVDDMSLNKIVKFLNVCNIKTSMNKKFSVSTLSRMLRNPKYKGYYCGKKSEVVDYMTKRVKYFEKKDWVMYEDNSRIPPIVNEEIWNRALNKLEKRSNKFGVACKNKITYQNRYSLSSKLICSKHNAIFYRRKLSKKSDEIVWWCSEYLSRGKEACSIPAVRQSEFYTIFDDIIKSLSIDLEEVIKILLKLYQSNKSKFSIEEEVKKQNDYKEIIGKKKDKLLDLNMSGALSNVEFKEKNDKYNIKIAEIDEKIEMLVNMDKGLKVWNKENRNLEKILNKKIMFPVTKEYLIKMLLNKVIVSFGDDDKKNIKLKVVFNFSNEYIEKNFQRDVFLSMNEVNCFFNKNYQFSRGFDKMGTKRYIVKYNVECYGCCSL